MEVADQVNISQAQVSRLEKNALKTLRRTQMREDEESYVQSLYI